jgi:hypothetical protein
MPNKARVSKKVDYALAFSTRREDVFSIYERVSLGGLGHTISQTTDAYTKRIALFSGLEVKQSNGGNTEALAQLSIWLTAGLEKTRLLSALSGRSSVIDELRPMMGWTVIGHDWHTYIAFRAIHEGQDRVVGKLSPICELNQLTCGLKYVEGPIESLTASTRTYYGIFKLLDLISRVSQYAGDVYWPWLRDDILEPML